MLDLWTVRTRTGNSCVMSLFATLNCFTSDTNKEAEARTAPRTLRRTVENIREAGDVAGGDVGCSRRKGLEELVETGCEFHSKSSIGL